MTVLPQLEIQLELAAREIVDTYRAPARRPSLRRARGGGGRGVFRVGGIALMAVLGVTAAALAASGVFAPGSPVTPPYEEVLKPTTGFGTPIPSSIRQLPVEVPDPVGGPPWGMRYERTTRGLGCLQVGRLVAGQLVVLGEDNAFANDGRAHPLPPDVLGVFQCATLDAHDHAFFAVPLPSNASASPIFACLPATDKRLRTHPATPVCTQGDPRILYYGLLGPDAISVTYTEPSGSQRTVPTTGNQGAYLIVTAPSHLPSGFSANASPMPPITRVTYRDGHTCETAHACPPVGYVPAALPLPTQHQIATPVHFALHQGRKATTMVARFRARFPVRNISAAYEMELLQLSAHGHSCLNGSAILTSTGDVLAGQLVTLRGILFINRFAPPCPGRYQVRIFYTSKRSSLQGLYLPSSTTAGVTRTVGRIGFRLR